jgi:hypothetical protein
MTLTRGTAGVGDGDGLAEVLALGDAGMRKLGSGSGVPTGPAIAVGEGSVKISSAASRAASVAKPAYACGAITATSRIAAIGMASRRAGRASRGSHRLEPTATSRQIRSAAWRARSPHSTAGSNRVAASRGRLVVARMPSSRPISTRIGSPNSAARCRRPAAR